LAAMDAYNKPGKAKGQPAAANSTTVEVKTRRGGVVRLIAGYATAWPG
jgi:hypothetical protein